MMHVDADAGAQWAGTDARILVVADWTVDPEAVVEACGRHDRRDATSFALVVPAWLHGLDWAGDPAASTTCAERQVERIVQVGVAAGLEFEVIGVGDPDPISAIGDALWSHPSTEILLFGRERRFGSSHPLDLVHRARRASGLPVQRISVPAAAGPRERRGWMLLRGGGHCDAGERQAA
jgi:hypothetical protein